jgi:protein-disulfide isomerase
MKTLALLLILPVVAAAAEISREDLKKAIDANPDLVIDALKSKKRELFMVVIEAQQEEQARRQKEEAEAEQKEFEEAFKKPMKASIPDAKRVRGPKKAKYTLVEYSDFQCPYCAKGWRVVEDLRKKHGDDMRFIFKNKPLPFHDQAMPASRWFEAVALQSPEKAWEFHDKLFSNQGKLGEAFYKELVAALGLDVKKAEEDANSKKVQEKIDADMKEAEQFGFSGTPGFLLNGIPVRGAYPIEKFEEIIKKLDEKKGS